MIFFRYFFGVLWCLFVWLFTAIVVGAAIGLIFPPPGGHSFVGVGLDWRNLPGTILGFFAAMQSWRRHVAKPGPKPAQTPPPITPGESTEITGSKPPGINRAERADGDPY